MSERTKQRAIALFYAMGHVDTARRDMHAAKMQMEYWEKQVAFIKSIPGCCDLCEGRGEGWFGGDNVDGPRMATCPRCKGSGEAKDVSQTS